MKPSNRRKAAAIAVLAAALLAGNALAQERPGVVTQIFSGDSVKFSAPGESMTVRLADVVAPAAGSPHAQAALDALAKLCLGKAATLRVTGTALDGATIGHLTCAGRSAAREQLRLGLAEVRGQPARQDTLLADAQREAQSAHRGLWRR